MAEKQKNIKKQTKTNKVKFGLRKLDFKKNWKKLSYLGLSGFLALTSVGYGTWKSFDHSANAAGWITVKKAITIRYLITVIEVINGVCLITQFPRVQK